ncbi:MAG TPA: tRNA guanosine(34) transglycosylase Tgt, partial [Candidatus Paceibacterota bacterium]
GKITTPHGVIETPAFVVVGTKATVKSLTPEQVKGIGAQVVLGNTYHLFLQPGDEFIRDAEGLGKFMHWDGPTMTDSGGFQVFSLGAGMGRGNTKFEAAAAPERPDGEEEPRLAKIDEEGVTFRSHIDGKEHRFTPEKSMEIQHNLGADIIFAFDECTLPTAPEEYQREAMERTHRWALRSLEAHKRSGKQNEQALFGIVQGGRYEELRKESAKTISAMGFDGFGIGGSFSKEDLGETLSSVNKILPEEKPRHLLGIGEPEDLFAGVENGIDTFDCVLPTRLARNGTLYTKQGKINITNAKYTRDFSPLDTNCNCYTCINFTRAYLSHLFRAKEMLAATLASIHNLYFVVHLVADIRQAVLDENMPDFKARFMAEYKQE